MIAVRNILSAALAGLVASFLMPTTADSARIPCHPKVMSPTPGAKTSTTPTIKATARHGGCDPNVKHIRLQIFDPASGNAVYTWKYTRGKGLLTGRGYEKGMPLFEHTIPEGELAAGQTYRVEIGYDLPAPLTEIYYRTESFKITTREAQDKTARQGQSKRAAHTIVIDGRATSGGTLKSERRAPGGSA